MMSGYRNMEVPSWVLILIGSGLVAASLAYGADRLVPDNYTTIQAAIDNASAGDVVILAAGTYSGAGNQDLDFGGKAITVRSTNPDNASVVAATIIDCQGTVSKDHRAFLFSHGEDNGSAISGLTIQNGGFNYGGAIRCENASRPTIRNCVFLTNRASIDGGAVYCIDGSAPAIINCTFSGNTAQYGGAIYCNASHPTITGCTFNGNSALSSGGAIACWTSHPAIGNCLIYQNTANNSGGGIYCYDSSAPVLNNCTIYGNTAAMYGGGGVYGNAASNPVVKNSILWDNLPQEIQAVSGTPSVRYSDIKGGWTGIGNINEDPLFADAPGGDFHLRSAAGRWDPVAASWVIDNVTSSCVDAGDPAADCTKEPPGPGQQIEMGGYGNTPYASKSLPKVTLTARATDDNGTVSPTSGTYPIGKCVTLTATPRSGYRVVAWTGTDNDPGEGNNTNTVTMTDNKTVTVQFGSAPVPAYALTTNVLGGRGRINPDNGTINISTVVPLTAIPDEGYRVKAWTGTDNDSLTGTSNTVTMNANRTVTVEFERITCTLTTTVAAGEGTVSPPDNTTYDYGTVVTLTATPGSDYTFTSWQGTNDDGSTHPTNTVTLKSDRTVTVRFSRIMYVLSLGVTGGHGTLSSNPSGPNQGSGTTVALTAVPEVGFRVKAWTGTDNDPAAGTNNNTVRMTDNKTVTVEFEPAPPQVFTLAARVTGTGGSVSPLSGLYDNGTVVPLTATPLANYRVKAWTGADNLTSRDNTNTVTMTDNKTVTVEFIIQRQLKAAVGTGGHGTVSPDNVTGDNGTIVTLTATPETGYCVKSWSGTDQDPAAGSNTARVTMNADRAVTVTFEAVQANACALTASVVGGHGSVSPESGAYPVGATVTLTAHPDDGYAVKAWTGTDNDTLKTLNNTIRLTDNASVSVEFEPIFCELVTNVIGKGTLTRTPDNTTYLWGTTVALTATPDTGYCLGAWYGADNDSVVTSTNTATLKSPRTVTVWFSPIMYSFTKTVVGDRGTLLANPSLPSLPYGTVVNLTAVPSSGYRVKCWTGTDIDPSEGSNTNKVTIHDNTSVSVEFEALPPETFSLTARVVGEYGAVYPATGAYVAGTVLQITAAPYAGYRVKQWHGTDNDNATDNTTTAAMNENREVTVEFEKIIVQYTLTASVTGGHGTVAPSSGSYDEGTVVTLAAAPDAGFRVRAWTGADQGPFTGSNTNTATMYDNRTVSVEFEEMPTGAYCSLTVTVTGGRGTVHPAGGRYFQGSTVALVAAPEPGYRIKSWSGTDNDNSTDLANAVTLGTDKAVILTLEPVPATTYILTVSVPGGHGTVYPPGGTCLANTTVKLTAVPESGYHVQSWSGTDNDPAEGSLTNLATMTADKTVTVTFASGASAAETNSIATFDLLDTSSTTLRAMPAVPGCAAASPFIILLGIALGLLVGRISSH